MIDEQAGQAGAPGGGGPTHYQMRQKLIAFGDDYWIENERGEKVYKVDGQALRIRKTLILEDRNGQALAKIQEQLLRIRNTMEVEDAGGRRIATVKKSLLKLLRDHWTVNIKDGPDLQVYGNILDHEYTIGEGRARVATVSKQWFRLRDTYGVEIAPGQDDALVLAVTVCIDVMGHRGR